MSTFWTRSSTTMPCSSMKGRAITKGTFTTSEYRLRACPSMPCSWKASPWSEAITMIVLGSSPIESIRSTIRPSRRSVQWIDWS